MLVFDVEELLFQSDDHAMFRFSNGVFVAVCACDDVDRVGGIIAWGWRMGRVVWLCGLVMELCGLKQCVVDGGGRVGLREKVEVTRRSLRLLFFLYAEMILCCCSAACCSCTVVK